MAESCAKKGIKYNVLHIVYRKDLTNLKCCVLMCGKGTSKTNDIFTAMPVKISDLFDELQKG